MAGPVGGRAGGIVGLVRLIEADPKLKAALTVDAMKHGRSIHQLGSVDFSWWEARCLIMGRWPEMHVTRHIDPRAALLEPSTFAAILTADATRNANWQRGRGGESDRPEPTASLLYGSTTRAPEPEDAKTPTPPRRQLTPDDPARIRAELARMRKVAVPVSA